MKVDFIETENYTTVLEAIQNLKRLPMDAPRIGLAFGNYGLGKTSALERIAAQDDSILLMRAGQTWSKRSALDILCTEFGLDTKGHSPKLFERVRDHLLREEVTIVVDEVDTILKGPKVEVLEMFRDLHDETGTVVFFIGMEEANAKFKRHRHYYSRIVQKVKFKPIGINDIEKFCQLCEVKIDADLLHYLSKQWPNLREIRVMLLRLEEYCEMNGFVEVDLKTFKGSGVENGIKG